MAHKFFYSWQTERPNSVCRSFIKKVLETVSESLNQSGIDERIEIDSDTQGVPGTPEILSTILRKIDEDDVFVADLTICAASKDGEKNRLSPNSNVMFEYGYALKAKGRDRIVCVMNAYYGGADPAELPFDLRHARAPIRYTLPPEATADDKKRVFAQLSKEIEIACRLIIENLPNPSVPSTPALFDKPQFKEGDELTPEGDHSGQIDPTYLGLSPGFIYVKARPLKDQQLTLAQVKKYEKGVAGLSISNCSDAGTFGSNRWGRISYALARNMPRRTSYDYVQYYKSAEVEIVNWSYLLVIGSDAINLNYLAQKMSEMLGIAKEWMEKIEEKDWAVEVGIAGIEKRRVTLRNYESGPLIHQDKVTVRKKVDKDSILLLAEELRTAILEEVGV